MGQYKRAELFKRKVHTAIFLQTIPEVVKDLIDRHGAEKAAEDLRDIGVNIANILTNYWMPESHQLKDIIKEVYNKFWMGKIKIRVNEREIVIRDYKCALCASKVEIEAFHLCTPISSFLEGIIHILSNTRSFPFSQAQGKTIHSRSAGDKFCEHVIELTK